MVFIGGLDPMYVLDRMESYEIGIAMEGLYLKSREDWERTRFIAYVIAQVNSKDRIKPTDILHFGWDSENEPKAEEEDEEYTAWIEEQMEQRVKEKNKNNGSGSSNTTMVG